MKKIFTSTGIVAVYQSKLYRRILQLGFLLLLLLPSLGHAQTKICWPAESAIGNIYSKSSFSNISDFTPANGITLSLNGTGINVSGGGGTFNRYATLLTPHSFSNYSFTMDVKMINAADPGSYGIGLGLKSINSVSPNDVFGWVNLSTVSTPGQLFLYTSSGSLLASSTSTIVYSKNDVLRQTFSLADTIMTYTVQNITSGAAAVSLSLTCHNDYNGPVLTRPNASNFAIYEIGGTFMLQSAAVNISDKKNTNIAVASDSKFAYYAESWTRTWPAMLDTRYSTVTKACGSGDQAAHGIQEVNNLALLNPRYLIWEYGSNDLRAGTPLATVEAYSDSIYRYFTAKGTTVYFILMPEDSTLGGVGQKSLDLWYRSHYPSSYISGVWDSLLSNNILNTAYYSDGHIHLNAAGHARIEQALVASGKFNEQGICGGCQSSSTQVFTASTQTGNYNFKGELGTDFTVISDSGIVVKQLGAFDDGNNGITGSQSGGVRVVIFNKTTQTIVPGLDITISGQSGVYTAGYRMVDITPVTLAKGNNYAIVAKGYGATEKAGNAALGGGPFTAGNNGSNAISFGNQSLSGPDVATGFSYPTTSAAYGANPQYLAGTFNFSRGIPCPSANAGLASLTLSQGILSPVFTRLTTAYTSSVSKSIASITVTAAAINEGATMKINGNPATASTPVQINLTKDSNNIVTIEVTAQDGLTVQTYTVNISKGGCESAAALAYVANTQGGNQSYRGELGMEFLVNNAAGIVIKQLGAFDDGGNGITGLQPGGGVRVAIFNKATHVIVPGLDVTISGLGDAYTGNHRMKTISPVTLPPGDYVIVAKGYSVDEKSANVAVGGGPYPAGDDAGGAISFTKEASYGPDDPNGFNYPSSAGDFGSNHQYLAGTFNFTKIIPCGGASADASLSGLVLNQGSLNPGFASVTTAYTTSVGKTVTSVTITPTAEDGGATIKVNGNTVVSGQASAAITLIHGSNIISIEVTAQDGTTKKTYTVSVAITGCESAIAQSYISAIQNGNQGYRGELGMEFIVNNPDGISIKQLGAFDDNGNGITGLQPGGGVRVAVFNRVSHAIVPGLDVTISGLADAYTGNHRMKNITPVVLPAGDYVLVTKGYGPNERNGNVSIDGGPYPAGDNASGGITFGNEASYGADDPNGFNYPTSAGNFGSTHQYLAGTFSFTKVVACDGPSTDASLSNIAINKGTLTPVFSTVTTLYSASVDKVVSSMIVTPTTTDTGATVKINGNAVPKNGSATVALPGSVNNIVIEVTAQDGTTKKTYTLSVTVTGCESGAAQAYIASILSGNQAHRGELGMEFIVNNPGGISIKQLGAFDDGGNGLNGTQSGGIRVAVFNRTTRTIVPGLDATIVGLGDAYAGNHRMKNITPVTLPPGDYTLVAKGYNADERNGNVSINGGPYPAGDDGGGAITFGNEASYGADDPNGFSYPANAGNFGSTHQYLAGTFSFTKVLTCGGASVDAGLTNILLSQGALTPAFTTVNTGYTASVDKAFTSVTVTPVTSDTGSTVKINGTPIAKNGSLVIPLTKVSTNVAIEVTAQDGTTKKTYTVVVSVTGCESNAALSYLSNTQTGVQAYRGELGMEFIVNNANGISIKQLGAFDDGGDGITGTKSGGVRVVIFNRNTHVAVPGLDVIVSGLADAYTSGHRMKNITPVTLPQGDYVIVAKGYNVNERNGNASAGGVTYPAGNDGSGAITFGNETSFGDDDTTGFVYPPYGGNFGSNHVFLAGTFDYTVNIACTFPGSARIAATTVSADSTKQPGTQTAITGKTVKIYPNPAHGQFNVQLTNVSAAKLNVQILNGSGQLVDQKIVPVASKTALLLIPFNLVNQPAGIYLVKIQGADGVLTEKLVLQR